MPPQQRCRERSGLRRLQISLSWTEPRVSLMACGVLLGRDDSFADGRCFPAGSIGVRPVAEAGRPGETRHRWHSHHALGAAARHISRLGELALSVKSRRLAARGDDQFHLSFSSRGDGDGGFDRDGILLPGDRCRGNWYQNDGHLCGAGVYQAAAADPGQRVSTCIAWKALYLIGGYIGYIAWL